MFFHTFDKTMEEVKKEMDDGSVFQLVDVRFEEEYIEGHLPQAIVLPLPQLETLADQVLKRDVVTYVYCRSGQRAAKATSKLKTMGYTQVYNIGGVIHWPYALEKGKE